jgi:hypothetical protein
MLGHPVMDLIDPEMMILGFLGMGILGLVFSIFVIAIIVFLEGVIYYLFKWNTFWRSVLDSLYANLCSAILGRIPAITLGITLLHLRWIGLLVGFMASILIEVLLLILLKRQKPGKVWLVVSLANVASYLLIGVPFLVFWVFTRF